MSDLVYIGLWICILVACVIISTYVVADLIVNPLIEWAFK